MLITTITTGLTPAAGRPDDDLGEWLVVKTSFLGKANRMGNAKSLGEAM
jgi:hypothetical protein